MTTDKKVALKQQLAEAKSALESLLNSLDESQWGVEVFSEGVTWTVKDIVAHLVETETGMSIQVHKTRKGQETVPEGFDLDRWNNDLQKRMGNQSIADLMAGLEQTRTKTLAVLDSIEPHEWALEGRHPSQGIITIEQYYRIIAGHQQVHAEDIRACLGMS